MFNRSGPLSRADIEGDLGSEPEAVTEALKQKWTARRKLLAAWATPPALAVFRAQDQPGLYDHLWYAACIEMTGAENVMRRVLFEAAHGEVLGTITKDVTYAWLRTTEELFFSFGASGPASTVSQLRPAEKSTRFNAYGRMFGDAIPEAIQPDFSYEHAKNANSDFVPAFTGFLTEFWQTYVHARNAIGPSSIDYGAIATLARRLRTMLNERRGGTNTSPALDRQEFSAVAEMSWFHFLLQSNNAVLEDLDATGADATERLRRLGARVGGAVHPNATGLFLLAPRMSLLLTAIEAGIFDADTGVRQLFVGSELAAMLEIVNHWDIISGLRIKATAVLPAASAATPALLGSR